MPILIHIPMRIHTDVWQKPPQYCEIIILQLKKKAKNSWEKERQKQSKSIDCLLA